MHIVNVLVLVDFVNVRFYKVYVRVYSRELYRYHIALNQPDMYQR
jgi:hypothetical protein